MKDLIFLENNIVWFWNSLDVQSTDSSVELYNILSYSRFFFKHLFAPVFGKEFLHNSKEIVNLQGLFLSLVA